MQITKLESILESEGIVFLTYGGLFSQSLIVGMTEALEKESENNEMSKKVAHNLLTIFIELSQNMMNYSKQMASNHLEFNSKGLIIVGFDKKNNDYYIFSRNMLLNQDKEKITPRIEQILPLDKDALKTLYRTLRKSGKDKHERGAGIGFIEIARRCDGLEYHFNQIDEASHYFALKVTLHNS